MLKILFLAANPTDTTRLQLGEEVRAIDEVLRKANYRDYFELETHLAVRVDDLQDLLLRHHPHIVHFSGHGSQNSEIILQDHDGNGVAVPPMALSMLFQLLKDNIRCVVLNCCYSTDQAAAIARHIDCVVGVSDEITDAAARHFAASFYQGLAYGRSVGESYTLGTIQLSLFGLADEHKPQLLGASDPASAYLVNPERVDRTQLIDPAISTSVDTPIDVYRRGNIALSQVSTPKIGKLPNFLTEQELLAFLDKHGEWSVLDTRDNGASGGVRRELYRVYEFPSYRYAFEFMTEISKRVIVPQNHHPRWQNTWNRVEIWLTTFNVGYRPSTKDRRFAESCEQIWSEIKKRLEW